MHIACMSRLALGVALPTVAVILTPKDSEDDSQLADTAVAKDDPKSPQQAKSTASQEQKSGGGGQSNLLR
ncbi:hypothetical protein LTR08_006883 [Meristemomyces frigidus]|nr:hypothetical protein LTR08_006883 [Meristemomyces frigidus]